MAEHVEQELMELWSNVEKEKAARQEWVAARQATTAAAAGAPAIKHALAPAGPEQIRLLPYGAADSAQTKQHAGQLPAAADNTRGGAAESAADTPGPESEGDLGQPLARDLEQGLQAEHGSRPQAASHDRDRDKAAGRIETGVSAS